MGEGLFWRKSKFDFFWKRGEKGRFFPKCYALLSETRARLSLVLDLISLRKSVFGGIKIDWWFSRAGENEGIFDFWNGGMGLVSLSLNLLFRSFPQEKNSKQFLCEINLKGEAKNLYSELISLDSRILQETSRKFLLETIYLEIWWDFIIYSSSLKVKICQFPISC